MHRSGTSAVARVVGLMGAEIGTDGELLPAHATDNPTGYWERAELNAIHDELLASGGYAWDRLAGFDLHKLGSDARQRAALRSGRLVEKLSASSRPWLLKDPRLCLLLGQWQALLQHPACVVVVRDPREIAASMSTGPRGTFTSPFVVALWEKYLHLLLAELSGKRALFVSYARLLADPSAQCTRILNALHGMGVVDLHEPRGRELEEFLDATLKRSVARAHVQLSQAQQRLQHWLESQCEAVGAVTVSGFPDMPAPDAVLAEFEAAFDHHVEQGRAQARADTAAQLQRIESRLELHAVEREDWRRQLTAQHQQLTSQHEQIVAQQQQINAQHERLLAEHERLLAEHERSSALGASLAGVQQQRDTLAAQIAERTRDIDALNEQVRQQHRSATELSDSVLAMRSSWSWKLSAPLRLFSGLRLRPSVAAEQRIYRLYYSIPGLNAARKRAAVLWLHRHAPWLTRHTLSYRLYEQTQQLLQRRAVTQVERERAQRMDAARAAQAIAALARTPLISIAMPVYDVDERWLTAAVDSVRNQFYPHWQLCIADDASTRAETRQALAQLERLDDPRIRVRHLPKNLGIAGASNAALEMASGEFVGLLDNDDVLTRDALLEMAQRIVADDPDLLYSDEDKLDEGGANVEPHFKPDYNEDYLLSINYICHFSVIRRELLDRIGGFRGGFDGAQDYDLLLRATEQTRRIAHIPKVLYHWRRTSGSTAAASSAKPQTSEAGRRALAESLARRGIDGNATPGPFANSYNVRRAIRGEPLVSILIPFRDKPELLDACVASILAKTRYRNFEIVGIDNNSADAATHACMRALEARDQRVRFVRHDAPFNYSAINNFGVRHARGEHLLFLNNDTEVIADDWLEALLEHSQRPEVGVVGAKLLYADDTIQHSGVIVGLGGVAGHAHLFLAGDDPGYFARAQLTQDLSAVTFACAMTRRDVFDKAGGLNETDLCIAFNDIDYCLRVREAGYLIVYTPNATLYHYESKSRGYEDTPEKQMRFGREIRYMQQRHAVALQHGDPYYNPNLSLTNCYQPDPNYANQLPL